MNLEPLGSSHPLDVICAGIVIADCVARPVVKQALPGQLELVERIGLYAGGSAFNTASDLVRLGLHVALVGRVGEDGFGDFLMHAAQRAGCNTEFLSRDAHAPSSATLVTVDPSGERAFLHSIGANAGLEPHHIPLKERVTRGARVLHLAGFFILPGLEGGEGEPARALFQEATRLGLTTSLDCVWDATGRWSELIGPVLEFTDLFCPSIHEARAIVNMSDEHNFGPKEVAEALFQLGVRQTVALKGVQTAVEQKKTLGSQCTFEVESKVIHARRIPQRCPSRALRTLPGRPHPLPTR